MDLRKTVSNLSFVLLFLALFNFYSQAQVAENSVSDSLRYLPIEITDIPFRSAKTLMQTKKIVDNLISDEEISLIKTENDSIINLVEENISLFQGELGLKSVRYLENRSLQLQSQKEIVDHEINEIAQILNDLDGSLQFLNEEKRIWADTKDVNLESAFTETITNRINIIFNDLDSAKTQISLQAEKIIYTLDRSSMVSIHINEILADMKAVIQQQEKQLLLNNHPNIFKLDYSAENFKLFGSINNYFKSEWIELKSFISSKSFEFIVLLMLFALTLILFIKYGNALKTFNKGTENYYRKKLNLILSNPISISILLTLFLIIFIIPERPLVFKDLTVYVIVFPIFRLMKQLVKKDFQFIIYGFAIMIMLNIIFIMLSPENITFRFLLIFFSIAHLYFIYVVVFRLIKLQYLSGLIIQLIKLAGLTFGIMSLTSLYGALAGNVMIAQKILSAINTWVTASSILFVIVITINGLLLSFMENKVVFRINSLKKYQVLIKTRVIKIFNFIAISYAVIYLFKQLNIWEVTRSKTFDIFNYQLSLGNISFSLGMITIFFLVIYLSIVISKVIQVILEDDILSKLPLEKGLPHTIATLIKYAFIAAGIFLAVSSAGIQLSSLTVIIGAFGVGIGFGLQNIFNNLVSGLILLFERPVQIGDTIEVGSLVGIVKSIGIRSSNVKTFDGAEVIVPNGQLISNELINWTLSDQQRRIEIIVGVSYDSNPHQVKELIMEVLNDHKEVISYPPSMVNFIELGDSSLNFQLFFWIASSKEWIRIRSEVLFLVFDKMKENNIEIPFPQRDLNIRNFEPEVKINKAENKE